VLINGFMSTGAGNPGMQRGQIIQASRQRDLDARQPQPSNSARTSSASPTTTTTSTATIAPAGMSSTAPRRGPGHRRSLHRIPARLPGLHRGQLHQQAHHGRARLLLRLLWPGRLEDHAQSHAEPGPALRAAPAHPRDSLSTPPPSIPITAPPSAVQAVKGAVVVPNAQALSFESASFANAIAPTPILTAAQAGIPEGCATRTRPIGVRGWALPGGLWATTRPCCAAAGDASLKRRWASRWSPAGPSMPAIWPPTTRTTTPME
jgi:hypothetical protein